jgi:hypothetical protein
MRTKTFCCMECDAEIEAEFVYGETPYDDDWNLPENCPSCGEVLYFGEPDVREDFHSDI